MKIFLLSVMILAQFSVKASAQIAKESYHATIEASSSEVFDVAIQIDQLSSLAILFPQSFIEPSGDIDLTSQIVNKCIYEYSAPVARATLTVKNAAGKLIGSSQQSLIAKYRVSEGSVASPNISCPLVPKEKAPLPLMINPHLTAKVEENMILDLHLSLMKVSATSQKADEKTGVFTLSGLSIGSSDNMIWKFYSPVSNEPQSLGQIKFSKN